MDYFIYIQFLFCSACSIEINVNIFRITYFTCDILTYIYVQPILTPLIGANGNVCLLNNRKAINMQ